MRRRDFVAAAGIAPAITAGSQAGVSWLTRERYRGVYSYPPTPFAKDLSLDEDALRSNLRRLVRIGVNGIVVAGSTGEFYTLSADDYRRIAIILREETKGTGTAGVLGAAGLNNREVIAKVTVAMEAGLDAVLAMQPFYNTLTNKELLKFWEEVAHACPRIGIIIYNFEWVRQEYTAETFRQLAVHPNIIGSKEAHYDFKKWRAMQTASPLVHMSATDGGWMVEMHRLKGPGVGSVSLTLMPHVIRDVLLLCKQGKYMEADRAFVPFTEALGHLRSGGGRPFITPAEMDGWGNYGGAAKGKALADIFGFLKAGPPRPPGIAVPYDLQQRVSDYVHKRYPELIPPADFAERLPSWV
ncbi:MAG: dihydrodipicolinate synthase family protein [Acidobacteria bacterium]|nr:dihydrodipicolinate synthase family protein [Acidobacteriota bacterium]